MSATLTAPDPAAVTPPLKSSPTPPPDEPLYGGLAGLWRFSVADYQAMIRAEILGPRTRVELLNGLVVRVMPQGTGHIFATRVLTRWFCRTLSDGWTVGPQTSTALTDSQTEPDISVARGNERMFADRYVEAADLVLVIEVADSSLRRDRREKLAIYAAAGVPEYWVVNVPDRQVEVYTRPAGDFYDGLAAYRPGQDVPVALDGHAVGHIPVADLFPAPGPA
jgi:Uma2 family endonuclease